jgi:hypothetical protein
MIYINVIIVVIIVSEENWWLFLRTAPRAQNSFNMTADLEEGGNDMYHLI